MAFSINSSTPPAEAAPTAPHTPGVVHPRATGYDGLGRPVGAVGQAEALVGRSFITAAGLSWWLAFFSADPTAQSVTVTDLNIYDPLLEGETTYSSAEMQRPTWNTDDNNPGSWYTDFRVRFTALTA